MHSNRLEFPEPYKHQHPPVCDAIELFEGQLTFSQKAADWLLRGWIMEIHFSANRHIWRLDFDECNRLALPLGPLPLYFDESGSISAGIPCSFDHLDQSEPSRKT